MTTEPKRKNIDYSASAVNLTNPVQLQVDLRALDGLAKQIEELQAKMDACIPQELITSMDSLQTQRRACEVGLRSDIESYGSFQDLSLGWYAVKQRKVSVSYDAARFKFLYPQYALAVIIESVDTAKLKGLLKGGLLREEDLKHPDVAIAKESESFAYIVKI